MEAKNFDQYLADLRSVITELSKLSFEIYAILEQIRIEKNLPEEKRTRGTEDTEFTAEPQTPDKTAAADESEKTEELLTIDALRKLLAEKAAKGFSTEIRSILSGYDALKLSDLDPKNYAEVAGKARKLGI